MYILVEIVGDGRAIDTAEHMFRSRLRDIASNADNGTQWEIRSKYTGYVVESGTTVNGQWVKRERDNALSVPHDTSA